MFAFGVPLRWVVVVAVLLACVLLLGEFWVLATLLFFRLIPFTGLGLYFFFGGAFPSFLFATLRVTIPWPSDSLAWIGEFCWFSTGCGPNRKVTCLLSSLKDLIGEICSIGEWSVPGGRDPEGLLLESLGGSMISSKYWISMSWRWLDPVDVPWFVRKAFLLEGKDKLSRGQSLPQLLTPLQTKLARTTVKKNLIQNLASFCSLWEALTSSSVTQHRHLLR